MFVFYAMINLGKTGKIKIAHKKRGAFRLGQYIFDDFGEKLAVLVGYETAAHGSHYITNL
jgi:hypothetical protein